MNNFPDTPAVELIPVDRITVINPRVRNKKVFKEIISNIAELGLKKPIRRLRPCARTELSCPPPRNR